MVDHAELFLVFVINLCRLMEGDDNFLSGILLNGDDSHVAGLDEMLIPNTQDTHVEVQGSRSTNRTKRSKNFQPQDDEVICSAWLNVSKDPINGANQTRTTFWGRVHAFYEEHNKSGAVRTENSIMHRWLTIQLQVNKFCSCYEAIKRRNQSGTTIEDKVRHMCSLLYLNFFISKCIDILNFFVQINEAKKLYTSQDKEKKTFGLDHCWNILKKEDKWKAKMVELAEVEKLAASKKNKKAAKNSRPRDEGGNSNEQVVAADGESAETEQRKRSNGIKKVKANNRRGGGEACVQALDNMWAKKEESDKEKEKAKQERFMASLEVDKQALELDKKRAEAELKRSDAELKRAAADLLKQEKEIMMANKVGLDTLQLEWLEMMQQEIVENKRLGKSI